MDLPATTTGRLSIILKMHTDAFNLNVAIG